MAVHSLWVYECKTFDFEASLITGINGSGLTSAVIKTSWPCKIILPFTLLN